MTNHNTEHGEREALADWLGGLAESYNITDHTDEQQTIITTSVEHLADLLLPKFREARAAAIDEAADLLRDFRETFEEHERASILAGETAVRLIAKALRTRPGPEADDAGCLHYQWLDRPESDTRECLICGTEVAG